MKKQNKAFQNDIQSFLKDNLEKNIQRYKSNGLKVSTDFLRKHSLELVNDVVNGIDIFPNVETKEAYRKIFRNYTLRQLRKNGITIERKPMMYKFPEWNKNEVMSQKDFKRYYKILKNTIKVSKCDANRPMVTFDVLERFSGKVDSFNYAESWDCVEPYNGNMELPFYDLLDKHIKSFSRGVIKDLAPQK